MNHLRRTHRLVLGFSAVTLALVFLDILVTVAQEQPPKTFRSSVDLVPVDVNVVDSTGRPVADLTVDDFSLAVDGKPRRIVSAQFITVARNTDAPESPATNYSSNSAAPGGRLIMIVIDLGNIGAGRGKYAIEAASRFIGRLSKSDRVGLTTIPGAGPRIDFTANHALVRTMLQNIVGRADERQARTGISEALAFARGNEQAIAEVVDRECPGIRTPEEIATCRRDLANEARVVYSTLAGQHGGFPRIAPPHCRTPGGHADPEDAGAPVGRTIRRAGCRGRHLARPGRVARSGHAVCASARSAAVRGGQRACVAEPHRGHPARTGRSGAARGARARHGVPRGQQRRLRVQPARARAVGLLPPELRAAARRPRRQAAQDQDRRPRAQAPRSAIAARVRASTRRARTRPRRCSPRRCGRLCSRPTSA